MAAASGDLWRLAGRPVTARRDYTISLTMNTAHAAAYAGRAEVAAMMGDARRAHADLAQAKLYGAPELKNIRQRIENALAHQSETKDPASLLAELDRASSSGATVEALLPLAQRLHRAAAGSNRQYSELYQDQLRGLEDAVQKKNKKGLTHPV